ncbi:hypothetical protein PHLCEN_2v11070 [Hermanssonia centrifuga]|uniref:Uncharacterized protein n=1 Tax=Hermanssonia centrifuga TaxID=98765 RepID=A0A2R6NL20_9APHY|nr:hypothetical protein PHLCEN_2v11070 [Hermanssonia centrifuga]
MARRAKQPPRHAALPAYACQRLPIGVGRLGRRRRGERSSRQGEARGWVGW